MLVCVCVCLLVFPCLCLCVSAEKKFAPVKPSTEMLVSPLTGELIPADRMADHMRFGELVELFLFILNVGNCENWYLYDHTVSSLPFQPFRYKCFPTF